MNKNEYIKYLIEYIRMKQKTYLDELYRDNDPIRIAYHRGGLSDSIDFFGYLLMEYKRNDRKEEKTEYSIESRVLTIDLELVYQRYAFNLNIPSESLTRDQKIDSLLQIITKSDKI